MAWIESHETLKEHPKLYELMDLLSINRPQAIGHLHLFWWWCINYAPTGVLKHTNSQIARAADWTGDPKQFVEALIVSRLLDRAGDDLHIHDWMDFCGALMERRLKRKESKRPPLGAVRPPTNHTNHTNLTNHTIPKEGHKFVAPTLEQVRIYCKSRNNIIDPEAFFNFYESKGWMVGKSKMKNWQAAMRTWEKREAGPKPGQPALPAPIRQPELPVYPPVSEADREEVSRMISETAEKLKTGGA